MRIAVVVGHSKLKNGCITSADGTKMGGGNEYKFNKYLAKHLVKALRKNGHEVDLVICPEKKFTNVLQEKYYKIPIVNNGRYDLVIELHLNSIGNKTAEGAEVLYISNNGRKYAERVQKALATVFQDRGTKKRDNLYMLNQTEPVAIMLETFFCTNKKEWKFACSNKAKIAKLIADGIGKA